MTEHLTEYQKRLCNVLQRGLPIVQRPFAETAKLLGGTESQVLLQARLLKELGIIRRIFAVINYHALGMTSTLAAAHVPKRKLSEAVETINALDNVSHNYLRDHYYNMWFTLQAETSAEIERVLSDLSSRLGIAFHNLPVRHTFKLDVKFDAEDEQGPAPGDAPRTPASKPVELDVVQKKVLSALQGNLKLDRDFFGFLCGEELDIKTVLTVIGTLIDKGVIRRIGAVVDHRRLGFAANVLFAAEVARNKVVPLGRRLARYRMVSHCYERKTAENWPYNLFAMMHARSMDRIERAISEFTQAENLGSFELLPTVAELKKQPVTYKLSTCTV